MDGISLSLYSVNLAGGNNCSEPLRFYQSILGGKVLKESFGHSELEIPSGLRIVFSKETEHCPVRGGTLTITIPEGSPVSDLAEVKQHWKFMQSVPGKDYALYEDSWGNWVWIYGFKN